MQSGGVEVGRGVGIQGVDVDGAPVVAEGCVGNLLDDRHRCFLVLEIEAEERGGKLGEEG